MASLKELKKRIQAVKNIKQMTRAMKMVAGARLKRAQIRAEGNRPFEATINEILRKLLLDIRAEESLQNPLSERRTIKNVGLLLITADKGLCGALNSSLIRQAQRFIRERQSAGQSVRLYCVGKKGHEYFKRRDLPMGRSFDGVHKNFSYAISQEISHVVRSEFLAGTIDQAVVLYSRFRSALSQKPTLKSVLPVSLEESLTEYGSGESELGARERTGNLKIGEPMRKQIESLPHDRFIVADRPRIVAELVERIVDIDIYHSMLESIASEHGARMAAMDSATKNASEMIDRLTLVRNRVRQAAITTELMEIVSGAEALRSGS